jgi:hypothetical protein
VTILGSFIKWNTGWQKMFVIFAKNEFLLPSRYPFYLKICMHNIQAISYLLVYNTSLSMYLIWSTRSRSRGYCKSTLVLNQYFGKDFIIYVVRCIFTRRICWCLKFKNPPSGSKGIVKKPISSLEHIVIAKC